MTTACLTTIAYSEHQTQSSIPGRNRHRTRSTTAQNRRQAKLQLNKTCETGKIPICNNFQSASPFFPNPPVSTKQPQCFTALTAFSGDFARTPNPVLKRIDDCVRCSLHAMVVWQAVVMVRTLREPMTKH